MSALYDLLPVLAFFVTYKVAGVYVATAVLVVATLVQVTVTWIAKRVVSKMALASAGLVLVFGGATLVLHDEVLIMWKPTVLYVLFALVLIGSQYWGAQPLTQRLLGTQLETDDRTWRIANWSWALFFLVLAAVNLVFVYRFRDVWVNWKLATVGIVFGFALLQALWLARRAVTPEAKP